MSSKDLVRIKVSKVIPADVSKIFHFLTEVDEFPVYVPSVKEAKVLERWQNRIKTKWLVQVDHLPISWVEEDIVDFKKNTIHFKAVEGDLQDFKGQWKFKPVSEGTLVTVCASISIDIPAITDFAKGYVEKTMTKNFEAILNAVESRIISLKYKTAKSSTFENIGGFGIIGHLYNFFHLERCLEMLNPAFKMPSREFLGQLFNVTPSFKLYDILNFKSKTGASANGCFIVATFIPDLIEKDVWAIFSKVVKACRIAEEHGMGIVTLGGFTSIVAERIGQAMNEMVDIPVTTGNTFTAAMALEGVYKAAGCLGLDLGALKVAIIGGTGDIGSACARVLTEKAAQVTITGRTKSNLKKMYKELAKKRKAKIIATTNNQAAIREADIIIACASATASILSIDWFKPGAIICDVGYPKNISYTPTKRDDILIFSGGLAQSPTPLVLPIDLGLPSPDSIYGCFAEAVILSLEGRYENFSFGRGNIMPDKVEEIRKMGQKHGFEVSKFWWGDKPMNDSAIASLKERIKGAKSVFAVR